MTAGWAAIGAHGARCSRVCARSARAPFPSSSNVWDAAIWSRRSHAARTSPAFPKFARKVGFAELWDQHGPPDLCRKGAGGDYRCE